MMINHHASYYSSRYLYLDGWRGLCIIAVLVGHFFPISGISLGRFGVEMFFVLSGRLMGEILFVNKLELSTFLKRRISRVWPALFFFLSITWISYQFVDVNTPISFATFLSCVTFTYNYVQFFIGRTPIFDHIWSLCIEEHIYIFLCIVALLNRRFNIKPITPILLATIFFMLNGLIQSIYLQLDYYSVYWRTDTRGASILVAVAVYLLLKDKERSTPSWLPIISFVVALFLSTKIFPDTVKYTFGSFFLALSLCTIKLSPSILVRFLSARVIVITGLISYSVYLWQQPFYILLASYPRKYLLVLLVICAYLSFKIIENPIRKFLNDNWTNKFSSAN